VDRSHLRSMACGLSPQPFLHKNNLKFLKIPTILHKGPCIVGNFRFSSGFESKPIFSHHFASKPLDLVQITFWSLYFYTKTLQILCISRYSPRIFQNSNFALRTSFLDIFSTVIPNQVILVPKFSESHPLSLQAIYILMIVAFI
jgi:hypothetical protein